MSFMWIVAIVLLLLILATLALKVVKQYEKGIGELGAFLARERDAALAPPPPAPAVNRAALPTVT